MRLIFIDRFTLGLFFLIALLAPSPGHATTTAKYVLLFQGDGMGAEHIRAGGMYTYGAAGTLVFEAFPNQTTMTHNNASNTTTDSAASASAMATGTKVTNGVISVRLPGNGLDMTSILELHKSLGKSVGLITESYLTDASPAAHGAHDSSRYNYTNIFNDYLNQSQPMVLLGGGGNGFDSAAALAQGYAVVTDRTTLLALNTETQTRMAGGFGNGLIPAEDMPGRDPSLPTLPEMTQQALAILDNDPDGFFAFFEQEGIDEASHGNEGEGLVKSVKELNSAVQKAIDWVNDPTTDADWTNTLLIVLADHETGGLTVTETNPQIGVIPTLSWTTTGHTQTPVRVFARGVDADQITGAQIDNTDIFLILGPPSAATSTSATLTIGTDTWIDSAAPAATHGADTKLIVDGSPDNGALVKWDLSTLPADSLVTSATLIFYLPDANDQSGSAYEVYASRRNWTDVFASWNNYDTGAAWGTAGAQNNTTDYFTTVLGMSPTSGTPPTQLTCSLNANGISQIQRWINGTDSNHGFVLFHYADDHTDGFRFNSFDSIHPPQLAINYALPVTVSVTPTLTPSGTASITATSSSTCTYTPSPSATESNTFTLTPTPTGSLTVTPSPTSMVSSTATGTITPSPSYTQTLTPSATVSFTPTVTPTQTDSPTVTFSPTLTLTPTVTVTASISATFPPVLSPIFTATATPTASATLTSTATHAQPWITQAVLAFPNPTRQTVRFAFHDSLPDQVHIRVYNLAGEKVADLNWEQPSAHYVEWHFNTIAPGLYFYQTTLVVNGQSKKLAPQKLAIVR